MKGVWVFLSFLALVAVGLFAFQGFIKEKTDIENPHSEIGEAVDTALGLNQARNIDRARSVANIAEGFSIQTAVVMYITGQGSEPKTLGDLVDKGYIDAGALTDSNQRNYRLVSTGGRWTLESAGVDGIRGTSDDMRRSVSGFAAPGPTAAPTAKPRPGFLDVVYPTPTPKFGPRE